MAGISRIARWHSRYRFLRHRNVITSLSTAFVNPIVDKQHQVHTYPHVTSRAFATTATQKILPDKAEIVICGGGVMGASVALHLKEAGWRNVVLLEQGSITCGTTWHSVGLMGRLKGSMTDSAIASYSRELYKQLDADGYGTGFKECGALYLARTEDRLIAYRRSLVSAERVGVDGRYVSPDEIKELVPHLKTDDLQGGFFIPGDGVVSAPDVAQAMVKKAKDLGVEVFEKVKVIEVIAEDDKVRGVKTDQGEIQCQYFVNTAGMWARELGLKCTTPVKIPLHACEHFYMITKPIEGVDRMMPVVRDYDGCIYLREWGGGILGGGFELQAKPAFHDGIPDKFEFQLLPEDWDQFQPLLEQMLHRCPVLESAEIKQFINGPESFTPDGKCILGESPEVQNYFVAAGMNSVGIAYAGGVGKYMAEWITDGDPSLDIWAHDILRFVDLHNNKKFLRDRVKETLGTHAASRPTREYTSCRSVKSTPLHKSQQEYGAVFEQQANLYERAAWFDDFSFDDMFDTYPQTEPQSKGAFYKPEWFDKVKSEYWACREGVCLIDMSTFTKFEFSSSGREAETFLQYVCSNDVAPSRGPLGTIVHTGMQNKTGGFENDCSVVRLADNRFFMIGPTAQQTRSYAWIKQHLPRDESVQVQDVTSMYTAINVIGPKAAELLTELTDTSMDKTNFLHMTYKEIDVGHACGVKAMRLTHSGEDGFILYIPSEYALHVYDSLMSVGKNYGIRNAGYYALRALRTEKFFAYWGTDLTPQTTPVEANRESRVKWNMPGFIGYDALIKQKTEGVKKRLVQFLLHDHKVSDDPWPWGGEPIYRNGEYCGTTTSTAYGFTLDRHVCLGYVQNINPQTKAKSFVDEDFIMNKSIKFEVDIAGKRFPAKASIWPRALPSAALKI